ncbi:hypothetical protein [Qipengyuania gelatinilytica]|uniref:Nucleoside 2-deoxyribosyltransferase n=1 Tax=Qipengyuania gelatinilytica TaxID=2867231 RepID=A0ABX9A208_9SPHN|nr:hypothetical protein [Qipengyuania gelatinilytica]QZD93928.1 hypothetical protein K3136_07325 [Qipengyuania gelatinilytica]
MADKEKVCFVISPIGSEGSDTRKRADKLLKYVIHPVVSPRGYSVERADHLSEPGIITNQIVRKILDADLLIADLSEGNPNVFYELAIRHGSAKPFVHIIGSKEKIPFDNAQVRAIQVDLTDLDSVDRAKTELQKQVKSCEESPSSIESPLSFAIEIDKLSNSPKSDEMLTAAIFKEVASLRRDLSALRHSGSAGGKEQFGAYDLLNLLRSHDFSDLADDLTSSYSLDFVNWGSVTISSDKTIKEDQKKARELTAALEQITRSSWDVDYIPF